MGRYYDLDGRMWGDELLGLSLEAKALWFYVLAGPAAEYYGLYRLSRRTALHDLEITEKKLDTLLAELDERGLFFWDQDAGVVWVRSALKYNGPKNRDHAKSIAKKVDRLPDSPLLAHFLAHAEVYSSSLADVLRGLGWPRETVSTPSRHGVDTVSGPSPDGPCIVELRDGVGGEPESNNSSIARANGDLRGKVREVFDYWVERSGRDPDKTKLTGERDAKVRLRLKSYSVDDLKTAIDGCLATPHNRGENERGRRYDDLELICRNDTKLEYFLEAGTGLASTPAAKQSTKAARDHRIKNALAQVEAGMDVEDVRAFVLDDEYQEVLERLGT